MVKQSREFGLNAEQKAYDYLVNQGLSLVTRNYRCRMGEVDLIMRERDVLVFIEVRARKSDYFGGAIASITRSKQKKLIHTALYYRCIHGYKEKDPFRFDVVGLQGTLNQIEWIKSAF